MPSRAAGTMHFSYLCTSASHCIFINTAVLLTTLNIQRSEQNWGGAGCSIEGEVLLSFGAQSLGFLSFWTWPHLHHPQMNHENTFLMFWSGPFYLFLSLSLFFPPSWNSRSANICLAHTQRRQIGEKSWIFQCEAQSGPCLFKLQRFICIHRFASKNM